MEESSRYSPEVRKSSARSKGVKMAITDLALARPQGRGGARQSRAERSNPLWASDVTRVSTWMGFVYAAFVVDVLALRSVDWKLSASSKTIFVLDAP